MISKKGPQVKLILIRRGESEWNKLNLFIGWMDVDLGGKGHEEAKATGRSLKQEGLDFDTCCTPYLKKAVHTLDHILDEIDCTWLPVVKFWKLNEWHYDALQGLNRAEAAEKHGEKQIREWWRFYDILPPAPSQNDAQGAAAQSMCRDANPNELPSSESLETTVARMVPYFNRVIKKDMTTSKRVTTAAHGNSLRTLVKYSDKLSEEDIIDVNIPTGVPFVYEFDTRGNPPYHRHLGDLRLLG